MPELNNINQSSEASSDIFGKLPSRIVRYGITVILLIFICIVIGCYFIKYPQTVDASIVITTLNPPADLVARTQGGIDTIFVVDGSDVRKGETVALLHSTANYTSVCAVEDSLKNSYRKNFDLIVFETWTDKNFALGDLQSNYEAFRLLCMDYRHYLESDYIGRKKALLQQQINKNAEYHRKLVEQQKILGQDLNLEYSSLARDSALYAKGIISKQDYETSMRGKLQNENTKTSFDAELTSTELGIMQTRQQLIELSIQRDNEIAQYERQLSQYRQQLITQIEQWRYQYVIATPTNGRITFVNYWSQNQQVQAGERIASVVPHDSMQVIGRMSVPSANFGKVERGQTVNVKLNGYPYMEFGMLKGFVKNISAVPDGENGYIAEITFPAGLQTTYKKHLSLIQQMNGTAEIITKDMRLIERFWQPIRSLFEK